MTPREVAASYDRIAERWSSERFNLQNGIPPHERALAFLPASGGAALDVGCGASGRIIDLLQHRGLQAEGLDLSAEMLRLARIQHPTIAFHHVDITVWQPSRQYAFISAWDSIWHVPLGEQAAVLTKLCTALAPAGVFIFSAGGVERPDERRDRHMGVPMYHASLGVPRILSVTESAGCKLRHFEYDQHPEAHVYFIVQRT